MSQEKGYIVMGADGREYGPVPQRQINEWISEGRLEKKTPVKPAGARDWIFLSSLPEFTEEFAKFEVGEKKHWPVGKWLVVFFLFLLAALIFLGLKNFKLH